MEFTKEVVKKIVKEVPGIYLLRNTLNGKIYIGQSIRLKKRLLQHLLVRKHIDNPLYRAFSKYGTKVFELEIVDTIESTEYNSIKRELDLKEKEAIQKYNSYVPNGYNQTFGGDGGILGYKFTEEQKHHVHINSIIATANRIYCYDIVDDAYYTCISRRTLENVLGIKGLNERNFFIHNRYLVARTEDLLRSKIEKYKRGKVRVVVVQKYGEREKDIRNGMKCKEWMEKWGMSKSSYFKIKARMVREKDLLLKTMQKTLKDAKWCIEEIKA